MGSLVRNCAIAFFIALSAGGLLAAGRGVVPPDLAEKVPRIFPSGSKPEQIRALCGDPEFINQFNSTIVVWRYVSGDNYLLFSFENGALAATSLVPQKQKPHTSVLQVMPEGVPPIVSSSATVEAAERTWKSLYGERGGVLGARIGSSKSAVLAAISARGLASSNFSCEDDASRPTVQTCSVAPANTSWKLIDPSNQDFSSFIIIFEDDRLRVAMQLVTFDDIATCRKAEAEVRAALASAFGKPAQKLGWLRRKATSMLLPMVSIDDGVRWEHETIVGSVARGAMSNPSGNQVPALMVLVSEKDD